MGATLLFLALALAVDGGAAIPPVTAVLVALG